MALPINPTSQARPYIAPPEGAPKLPSGLLPQRARRRQDEDLADEERQQTQPRSESPLLDIDDSPLDLMQQEAQRVGLAPVSQAHIAQLAERLASEPAFVKLVNATEEAFQAGEGAPDKELIESCLTELLAARPELYRATLVTTSSTGEPQPMNMRQLETNVVGMALAALLAAHIAGNADKRSALRRTEMFNAILNGLNSYVTKVLMKAQQRMSATLARRKGREVGNTTIVVDGVASDLNADFAPYNEDEERYEPEFFYDENHGGSRQMNQQDIQFAIDQAAQWRQTLMNNQSRQTNTFQGIDSNQTSHVNILTSLLKNIKDSVDTVTRNLAN